MLNRRGIDSNLLASAVGRELAVPIKFDRVVWMRYVWIEGQMSVECAARGR